MNRQALKTLCCCVFVVGCLAMIFGAVQGLNDRDNAACPYVLLGGIAAVASGVAIGAWNEGRKGPKR